MTVNATVIDNSGHSSTDVRPQYQIVPQSQFAFCRFFSQIDASF